ncbi:hypothetical protein [Geodermatophilus poikilotrophus]|uniref:hypothetical protein n=1 Tax=Geodermatophilus poikilotrophus TaxID=1333667 RepID=UPI001113DAD8|nr:hypothetical protein [Geodermatophilus poikilotrophus]
MGAVQAAARELALRQRGISVREYRTLCVSVVTVVCSTPEAQAFYRALGAYVDAVEAEPGDGRTRAQQLVDCLLDLVLRPGEAGLPPVQALLTIVASVHTALGGDAAGEVDDHAVPAEMARQLARALAGLDPRPAPTGDDPAAVGDDAVAADADGEPADVQADAPRPVAGAFEPVDSLGGPIERAVHEFGAADSDRWLDELVRDGFGADPAPGDPGWSPGLPPDPVEWDAGPWEDPCQWLDTHGRQHGPDLDIGVDREDGTGRGCPVRTDRTRVLIRAPVPDRSPGPPPAERRGGRVAAGRARRLEHRPGGPGGRHPQRGPDPRDGSGPRAGRARLRRSGCGRGPGRPGRRGCR